MNEPPVPGLMLAALIMLCVCAVEAWTFVILYARVRWWSTAEGRHLMRFTAILAVTFTLSVAFNVLPIPPIVRALVSLLVFTVMAGEILARIQLLRHRQHPPSPDSTDR